MVATILRRVGGWGLVALSVLFGLFAAGYAFEDPGGWAAVGMVALYAVPALLLALVAWFRPGLASVTVAPFVVLVALAWATLPVFPETVRAWFDQVGPVFAVATVVAAVALGVLGQHRPGLAGGLLVGLAVVTFVALVIANDALAEGPGPLGLLSTSSGVMILPMLVSGLLLITAAELASRGHPTPRAARRHRPAHA